jgi:hypothetical protein
MDWLDGLARTALLFRPSLLDAEKRGLNQAADETLAHGFART